MSIVERAIKKLQEQASRREQARPSAPVPAKAAATAARPAPAIQPAEPQQEAPRPAYAITLDLPKLRSSRLLPPPDQERELASQYRHIKRPLIQRGIGRGAERIEDGNAVMVTSALPGEGKSFTSLNLALSMALEQQLSVLLVDADVAKPRLTQEFGLQGRKGLLEALDDPHLDPEALIVATDVPTLCVLPSGRPTSTATELLAGPRMDQVVRQLCDRDAHRMIVFDSPPVLPTSEARALAHSMGQIVIVVRAGKTPQQAVLETMHLLGERSDVNLVLTHATDAGAGAYYYSTYGYGTYGDAPPPGPAQGSPAS